MRDETGWEPLQQLLGNFADLTRMFSTSSNWKQLRLAWKGWRDVTGKKMKADYAEQVKLLNKAARLDGESSCYVSSK